MVLKIGNKHRFAENKFSEWTHYSILLFMDLDKEILVKIVQTKMPFGKYKGTLLCDIPVHYLEWFQRQGFPQGKLGMQLQTVYEIKINGLDPLIRTLKEQFSS